MASPLLTARAAGRRDPVSGRWLLRHADFELAAGERVAVTGPSGAGKSVFLRALALLDPLAEGEVRFRGEPPAGGGVPAYRSRVLYLHQRPVLLPGPVRENLLAPLRFRCHRERRPAGEDGALAPVEAWLTALGRGAGLLEQRASELSGGEAQIVALLRALLLEPEVLLLDEPTASLDEEAAAAVEGLITAWHAAGRGRRGYLWVTHLPEQSARVADRRVRLAEGRLDGGKG